MHTGEECEAKHKLRYIYLEEYKLPRYVYHVAYWVIWANPFSQSGFWLVEKSALLPKTGCRFNRFTT